MACTETKMSSFWRNFHHWLHWKLSFWQLPVQPVMNISSKWRLFRFSVVAPILIETEEHISNIEHRLYIHCNKQKKPENVRSTNRQIRLIWINAIWIGNIHWFKTEANHWNPQNFSRDSKYIHNHAKVENTFPKNEVPTLPEIGHSMLYTR